MDRRSRRTATALLRPRLRSGGWGPECVRSVGGVFGTSWATTIFIDSKNHESGFAAKKRALVGVGSGGLRCLPSSASRTMRPAEPLG